MKVADLKETLYPEETVVFYDRFNRRVGKYNAYEIPMNLDNVTVRNMYVPGGGGWLAVNLNYGEFK